MFIRLLAFLGRGLIRLRYRVRITGLKATETGRAGILFLPNHPALIDPVIVFTQLFPGFHPHFLADRDQIDRPFIRRIAASSGVISLPDVARYGDTARTEVQAALEHCATLLQKGEHVVLYPAGHIKRQRLEELAGNSAVETILKAAPGARVVLLRTGGLWGSGFSRASGRVPDVTATLLRGIKGLFASGIFFAPRREVTIECVEPADWPRGADRDTINQYLEDFYNAGALPNTYVPYSRQERGGGTREMPEPPTSGSGINLDNVPAAARALVTAHLKTLTGKREVAPAMHLAADLGLDSLARLDLALWIEKEFGFPVGDGDRLTTVAEVMLAASGTVAGRGLMDLQPVPAAWRARSRMKRVEMPAGRTLTEVFLKQVSRQPDAVAVADQVSGARTYRDLSTAIRALKPLLEALPGRYIGIMLPASVGSVIVYLTALFAGKVPVMVNWTAGARSIRHSLDLLGVQRVISASRLVQKLESQGTRLDEIRGRFLFMEDLAPQVTTVARLLAWIRIRIGLGGLARVRPTDPAVVIFTSGSESLPKAVPLTHENLLTNIRDIGKVFALQPDEHLLGMLPPFHSFGITVTILLPLCMGLRTVYHAIPTEGGVLARLIEAYGVTLLPGTPTFLNGILRAADDRQLQTLRAVISGAEKCPAHVYEAVARRLPGLKLLEGYGISECSPVVSVNDENNPRPGSIGKVLPSVAYAIIDTERSIRVTAGVAGMLLVRGPSIFGGYLHYDGPSPFVEFEGRAWYRTGDLVTESADGVLTFTGRLKRFVKIGGEMISLPAIEDTLLQVYAKPEDDKPVLAVESAPTETNPELVLFTVRSLDREAVNQVIRDGGLSPLHNIRQIRMLPEIPVLGTGKTDYRALRNDLNLK